MCLVPNVKIPAKFKVPKFENYKGNTFPRAHLVMYVRGMSTHTDDQEMGLFPDVVIPPKFKVPDFGKYKGLTCTRNHMRVYCRKMHAHAHNQKLMIHCFQDSLSGHL